MIWQPEDLAGAGASRVRSSSGRSRPARCPPRRPQTRRSAGPYRSPAGRPETHGPAAPQRLAPFAGSRRWSVSIPDLSPQWLPALHIDRRDRAGRFATTPGFPRPPFPAGVTHARDNGPPLQPSTLKPVRRAPPAEDRSPLSSTPSAQIYPCNARALRRFRGPFEWQGAPDWRRRFGRRARSGYPLDDAFAPTSDNL